MELDLQCVASFAVLTQELHFGRAAARQHLSTSALSKRVSRLENQVGVRLLVRGPAGVLELTAAGRRLASDAVPLLDQARAVRHVVRRESATPVVVLGVIGELGAYPTRSQLATLGSQLRRHRPRVQLVCRSVPMAELTRQVLDGRVDVLCGAPPVPHLGVHLTPLAEPGLAGMAPAGHPLVGSPPEVFQAARRSTDHRDHVLALVRELQTLLGNDDGGRAMLSTGSGASSTSTAGGGSSRSTAGGGSSRSTGAGRPFASVP